MHCVSASDASAFWDYEDEDEDEDEDASSAVSSLQELRRPTTGMIRTLDDHADHTSAQSPRHSCYDDENAQLHSDSGVLPAYVVGPTMLVPAARHRMRDTEHDDNAPALPTRTRAAIARTLEGEIQGDEGCRVEAESYATALGRVSSTDGIPFQSIDTPGTRVLTCVQPPYLDAGTAGDDTVSIWMTNEDRARKRRSEGQRILGGCAIYRRGCAMSAIFRCTSVRPPLKPEELMFGSPQTLFLFFGGEWECLPALNFKASVWGSQKQGLAVDGVCLHSVFVLFSGQSCGFSLFMRGRFWNPTPGFLLVFGRNFVGDFLNFAATQ
ncbi:hypothetical protein C8R44DRAFT_988596 [Mycena epipterygia]|nr:hypothetical protein C8R44DRAFT_988596 [Mycena epipterygia]